jgi:hypothetical protein
MPTQTGHVRFGYRLADIEVPQVWDRFSLPFEDARVPGAAALHRIRPGATVHGM